MLDNFSERLIHDKLFCNLFRLAVCLSNDQLQIDIKSVYSEILKLDEVKPEDNKEEPQKKPLPSLGLQYNTAC